MARFFVLILLAGAVVLSGCTSGREHVDPRFAEVLNAPYRLGSGDRLRVVVFGQQNLTNTYAVDDSGNLSLPLIGTVRAEGRTVKEVEGAIAGALRAGYLREPSVSVQVDTYRPFFILGEVRNPGQFPYVSGLTAKSAAAVAGGFTPRARTRVVRIQRQIDGVLLERELPVDHPIAPGDTIHVLERWF